MTPKVFAEIGTEGENSESCDDSNLQPETTYFYKVLSTNAGGDSESQELEVTTLA